MLRVLRIPHALSSFAAASIGRFSFAMLGLGLLLTTQQATGSFAVAGAVTALAGISGVVAAPYRARAVDRFGQARALGILVLLHAGSLTGFAAIGLLEPVGAVGWLFVLAAVIGASAPPLGAAMRVIWSELTEPGAQRRRAFSLDSVCEELLFVFGPVTVAAIAAAASAPIAVLATAGCALVGTALLIAGSASRAIPPVTTPVHREGRPLRQRGFARVLAVLVGIGAVLGAVEIVAPAFAEQHGAVALSGWLLAGFAAGSAAGGLIYGHLRLASPLVRRLFVLGAAVGVLVIVVAWWGDPLWFGVGLVAAGAGIAPALITGYLYADEVVDPAVRTEASAWVNTAVNLGASVASAIAGVVIESSGPAVALAVAGAAALALSFAAPIRRSGGGPARNRGVRAASRRPQRRVRRTARSAGSAAG